MLSHQRLPAGLCTASAAQSPAVLASASSGGGGTRVMVIGALPRVYMVYLQFDCKNSSVPGPQDMQFARRDSIKLLRLFQPPVEHNVCKLHIVAPERIGYFSDSAVAGVTTKA